MKLRPTAFRSVEAHLLPSNGLTRRSWLLGTGAVLGSGVLGTLAGCGDGDNRTSTSAAWELADGIVASLSSVSQSSFRKQDYVVTDFGAQQCTTVAFTTPYTDLTKSLVSAGSDKTQAPASFDSRPAFLQAIATCSAAGGGRVVVPAGTWYCAGPIVLQSHVNFHLSANCTIYFSNNPQDYAKDGPIDCGANGKLYYGRWQANDCLNFGSPIYARGQTHIAITGEDHTSILNGQAMIPFAGTGNTSTCWWTYKGNSGAYGFVSTTATPTQASPNTANVDLKTKVPGISQALYDLLTNPVTPWQQDQNYLPALSEAAVSIEQRVFGLGHYLRPPMVTFLNCTDVLMENYQTQQTPFWQHHPVNCQRLVIRGVKVDSIGPNNDGFDPDACDTVLCEKMEFNTGDDCIAIKSAKNLDTEYGPSQNMVIQDCTMNSGHGGVTLGSEMGAGIQNVYARRLQMLNVYWDTNSLNIAIRIKTNMNRGGFVKNFYVDDVTLPHGVSLTGGGYSTSVLPGSPIATSVPIGVETATASNPSASQGGIITFDCDYQPAKDAIRTRPATVDNVHISNVRASNVSLGATTASCFQAIVAQGPVAFDYNGTPPTPPAPAISNVTITDCDFGTPAAAGPASPTVAGPIYAYNVAGIELKNVTIAGTVYNTTVTDAR
jgi:polygalacturonase